MRKFPETSRPSNEYITVQVYVAITGIKNYTGDMFLLDFERKEKKDLRNLVDDYLKEHLKGYRYRIIKIEIVNK